MHGDNWRVMCNHIYNLKKQRPSNLDIDRYPKVNQMVEQIILPNRRSLTDLVEEETPQLTEVPLDMPFEKVKSMFPAFDSDSEVELLIHSSPEPIQETPPYDQSGFEQEETGECCIVGVKPNCPECQSAMIPSAARGG